MAQKNSELKSLLDDKVELYNHKNFIKDDPISIPHLFSRKQDIEIMGFWVAILAWGQRVTIINKAKDLIARMGGSPYDFVLNHKTEEAKQLLGFKHRTFNDTDALYFLAFLKYYYSHNASLEDAFTIGLSSKSTNVEVGLVNFRKLFFSLEFAPSRTQKHIASPISNATCKRLNMFLRWMVRKDDCGVDFGIWNKIKPAQLVCPCDVHVDRVARKLGLIKRKQTDWQTALELTNELKKFNPIDPVRYDFALFGMGVEEKLL